MKDSAWRKRLLQSTRGKILAILRTGERTVNDLAAELELTDNAVRAHLASLERDGLIHQSGTQPGRPTNTEFARTSLSVIARKSAALRQMTRMSTGRSFSAGPVGLAWKLSSIRAKLPSSG